MSVHGGAPFIPSCLCLAHLRIVNAGGGTHLFMNLIDSHETAAPETGTFEKVETARTGKIARLPWHIRQQLNLRLENNEPGPTLLDWLNSLPEVQEVLEDYFDGRAISQQNLSAWKLGGFHEWQRGQEIRAFTRQYLDEACEVEEETYGRVVDREPEEGSLLDRAADRMAVGLLRLYREAELDEKGPKRTRAMLEITRELTKLRRIDHQRVHAGIAQQRWEDERERKAMEDAEAWQKKREASLVEIRLYARKLRAEFIRGLATGELKPRREKQIREYYKKFAEIIRQAGVPDLPEGEELEEKIKDVLEAMEATAGEEEMADADDGSEEDDGVDEDGEDDEEGGEDDEDDEYSGEEAVSSTEPDEDTPTEGATRPHKAAQGDTR
jgi:hypothetical protein